MNIGIYKIINTVNDKYYVGSSTNIERRWREHIKLLNHNRHHNEHLQHAWNKYGHDSFRFVIIQNTSNSLVKITEQKYLNIAKSDPDKSYNLNYDANGGEISEYSKEKIKQNKIVYWQNFEKRKLLSDKLKTKISSDLEYKKRISERTKMFYSNAENRKKASDIKKKFHSIPENKKRWSKLNSGLNNPLADKTQYHFFNRKTGDVEFCTRYELRINQKYIYQNLSQSGIAQLCLGKFSSYKGWIIDNVQ